MVPEIRESELGFDEIFSRSWELFKNRNSNLISITFILFVLTLVTSYCTRLSDDDSLTYVIIGLIVAVACFVVTLTVVLSISIIVDNAIKGQQMSYSQIWRQSWARTPGAFWTSILSSVIMLLLSLLLIIPGIIWMVYYYFMLPVVALRGLSGKKALNYSKALVKGNWWKVFGFLALLGIILGLIQMLIVGALWFALGMESLIAMVIQSAISAFVSVFFMVFLSFFFLNLDYLKNNTDSTAKNDAGELLIKKV